MVVWSVEMMVAMMVMKLVERMVELMELSMGHQWDG